MEFAGNNKPSAISIGGKTSSLSSSDIYSISRNLRKLTIDSSFPSPPPSLPSSPSSRASCAILIHKLLPLDPPSLAAADAIAICAMIDCCASAILPLSDAIAAFSCEAAGVDSAIFDFSGGVYVKDEADVAANVRALMMGSRGRSRDSVFSEIVAVHGGFREAARGLRARVKAELNSRNAGGVCGKGSALVALGCGVGMAIGSMWRISLGRARVVVGLVGGGFAEGFEKGCPSLDLVREGLGLVWEKDCLEVLRGVYELVGRLREVLAWEAVVGLCAVELEDSVEKRRRRKSVGRGSLVLRKVFRDWLGEGNVGDFGEWVRVISMGFDPGDARFEQLEGKIKEIVESNDVRRLPKIPKVRTVLFVKHFFDYVGILVVVEKVLRMSVEIVF